MLLWQFLFWIALLLLGTHYIGYPLIFWLMSQMKGKPTKKDQIDYEPTVTLVVSAYNEEKVIEEKLKNTLNLTYPKEKLKIIIVSDSSTDRTNKIVEAYAAHGIELVVVPGRVGKTKALNYVIKQISSEIIVFSDANSLYNSDAITLLVRHFSATDVGAVCGELRFADNSTEGLYWKYEQFVKKLESLVSTLTVYNGAIYAIRRELHREMNHQSSNDLQHAFQVTLQKYRGVYEPNALAYERSGTSELIEFNRHVRISSRSWNGLITNLYVLNPFVVGAFSLQFFFRKICRWLGPGLLLTLFVSNIALINHSIYSFFFVGQCFVYSLALIGWLTSKSARSFKPGYYAYYFLLINWASLLGFLRFVLRRDTSTWSPTTHSEEVQKVD
ncbi:MAG: glycosyltransferase family 2 protein [Firmicutes bacterium]|nr:glycosyltransferase family 2 protein [Bacillota bacterium]